jgi:hypothetical protein
MRSGVRKFERKLLIKRTEYKQVFMHAHRSDPKSWCSTDFEGSRCELARFGLIGRYVKRPFPNRDCLGCSPTD